MDLEISNASLMAINRTLERQMRKQASQLRRFKRLVRSGRFTPHAGLERSSSFSSDRPVSPAALSDVESSVSSHAIADESEDEDGGDAVRSSSLDVSEDEGDDTETETLGDSESESEDDEDDEDGGDVEKHRASDERRLNADLAKHKALLEASVKMNASLRRCQLVTDQLITDAKKALEYKVQASEVWIGGRVIYEDEEEEEDVEVEYPDGGYNVAHTQFEGNAFKGGPVVAPKPAGHPPIVSTGYRMAIPDPSDDVGSEGGDTDFDDAASAFGDRYDGDKYDTETESEWDGQSDAGSEVNMGLGLKLEDVESSVGSGPRYKLV